MKKRAVSPETETPRVQRRRYDVVDEKHSMMARFVSHFNINYDLLSEYLRSTGAIIAGSSILQLFLKEEFQDADLDIYVPVQHINIWKTNLLNLGFEERSAYYSTPYRQSFLFQNGIKQVVTFKHPNIEDEKKHVQLMSVRKKTSPVEVVKTFDLSFCQCWYDGTNFYANHQDGISKRMGYLAYNYAERLFDGSWIMNKRVVKYHNRGFTIKVPEDFPIQMDISLLVKLGQQAYKRNVEHDGSRLGDNSWRYYKKYYEELVSKMFSTPESMKTWLNKFIFHYAVGIEPRMSMSKRYGQGDLYLYRYGEPMQPVNLSHVVENTEQYDSDDEEDFNTVTANVDINEIAGYAKFFFMQPLRVALREIYGIESDGLFDRHIISRAFSPEAGLDESYYYGMRLSEQFPREKEFLESVDKTHLPVVINMEKVIQLFKKVEEVIVPMSHESYDQLKFRYLNAIKDRYMPEKEWLLEAFLNQYSNVKELAKAVYKEEIEEVRQFVGKTIDTFPVVCHQDFTKDEEIELEDQVLGPDLSNQSTPLLDSIREI